MSDKESKPIELSYEANPTDDKGEPLFILSAIPISVGVSVQEVGPPEGKVYAIEVGKPRKTILGYRLLR